jgi:predicted DsbA family dithiol-disulfide isomerase
MKIDFVSDVSCPWCAIGLGALEQALQRLDGQVQAELHFQPFELNPKMGPGGQDIDEHLAEKYGASPAQSAANREAIRQRGETVGFRFNMGARGRIYNTFDAHRLLHWAETVSPAHQLALKKALLVAYFGEGQDPSSTEVLLAAATEAGLDAARAAEVLAGGDYTEDVREREQFYLDHGIHSVPAVIINGRHLIQGGQPAEVFEQALRQIAAEG